MAIKLSYIFLRTLSITKNIPLFAAEGFCFNNNQPIKATGALYFLKKDGKILTEKMDPSIAHGDFVLPQRLEKALFTKETAPLYVLPAV